MIIFGFYFLITGALSRPPVRLSAGEQASIIYSNSGNLIIPIVYGTLGPDYVIYSCSYMAIQNLLMWSHGKHLMGGGSGKNVKELLGNPCMISIFLGLILFFLRVRLPDALGTAVTSLGSCLGPLCMMVVGVLMAEMDLREVMLSRQVWRTALLRLILCPLAAVAVLVVVCRFWQGSDAIPILTVVLLCATGPSASSITQMAQLYRSPENKLVSSINAMTTLLCAATMPLM